MRIAVMQPYFMPYFGYFQLIHTVDTFVFYDDVQIIRRGWLNRNKILLQKREHLFTIPLKSASYSKLIHQVPYMDAGKKLIKTIHHAYARAPYYNEVMPIIEKIFNYRADNIGALAAFSVMEVSKYLGLTAIFEYSSQRYPATIAMGMENRIIEICRQRNAGIYVNAAGGKDLYSRVNFERNGLKLKFLEPACPVYEQNKNIFVPNLSIIDVIMFNDAETIRKWLDDIKFQE
jgi:hypothetical protein